MRSAFRLVVLTSRAQRLGARGRGGQALGLQLVLESWLWAFLPKAMTGWGARVEGLGVTRLWIAKPPNSDSLEFWAAGFPTTSHGSLRPGSFGVRLEFPVQSRCPGSSEQSLDMDTIAQQEIVGARCICYSRRRAFWQNPTASYV